MDNIISERRYGSIQISKECLIDIKNTQLVIFKEIFGGMLISEWAKEKTSDDNTFYTYVGYSKYFEKAKPSADKLQQYTIHITSKIIGPTGSTSLATTFNIKKIENKN